eukprot:RCo010763
MDGLPRGRHAGLLDGLGERGVGVAGLRNALRGAVVLHRQHGLRNGLPRIASNDVHPKKLAIACVGENLHKAVGLEVRRGPGVRHEGEPPGLVLQPLGLDLLLCGPNPSHLWAGVNHPRNRVVVDVALLPGEVLRNGQPFILGLVRQHGADVDHVPNRVDPRNVGLQVVVHNDKLALVGLHPDRLEAQALGVRPPAHGDQHGVSLQLLRRAVPRLHGELGHPALDGARRDLSGELEGEPLLGQDPQELLRHVRIHGTRDAGEELHHRHLGTQTLPHGAKLQADDPSAHHNEPLGHGLELQRPRRGHDHLFIKRQEGQRNGLAARGDDDVLGLVDFFPRFSLHLHLLICLQRCFADIICHPVFLEEVLDALGELQH